MAETIVNSLLFAGVGVLFIGISIPLILERVPPNRFYGFRTAKTLSDPKVWYAANRASGHDLFVAGAVITSASIVMLFFGQRLEPGQVVFTLMAVMLLSLAGALIHGFRVLGRM
ncbi:MAG: SdpI family protein [Pyrinomonadaceae bacterium]